MAILKPVFLRFFQRVSIIFGVFVLCACLPINAHAKGIIDAFNLAPFIPLVLESMMSVAISLYNYFVGNGTGLIYICIFAFFLFSVSLYLVKIHLPKDWLSLFGFSGGGEMFEGKLSGWTIANNVLKPAMRVVIACIVLLQIKPVYVTQWVVNPFLEFGAIYTEQIFQTINKSSLNDSADAPTCPESISEQGWISKRSCDFLIRPVYIISNENNNIIKYGMNFIKTGLRGLLTLIPHGGENILNVITGLLLVAAFVSSNLFMALLIIQAIFDFCMALILYPFNVLTWTAKKSDKWFDVLPVFDQIVDALKKLVITMIACAFILCINLAVVRALFNWSSVIFEPASGGIVQTNVPTITNTAMNFGQHSVLWLSSILTFFLMQNIFKMTRDRLDMYTKGTDKKLYDTITGDAKTMWGKVKATPKKIETIVDLRNKLRKK